MGTNWVPVIRHTMRQHHSNSHSSISVCTSIVSKPLPQQRVVQLCVGWLGSHSLPSTPRVPMVSFFSQGSGDSSMYCRYVIAGSVSKSWQSACTAVRLFFSTSSSPTSSTDFNTSEQVWAVHVPEMPWQRQDVCSDAFIAWTERRRKIVFLWVLNTIRNSTGKEWNLVAGTLTLYFHTFL